MVRWSKCKIQNNSGKLSGLGRADAKQWQCTLPAWVLGLRHPSARNAVNLSRYLNLSLVCEMGNLRLGTQ